MFGYISSIPDRAALKSWVTAEAVAWICIGVFEYTTTLMIDMVGIRVFPERGVFWECAISVSCLQRKVELFRQTNQLESETHGRFAACSFQRGRAGV